MRQFRNYAIWALVALLSVFMIGCACEGDDCGDSCASGNCDGMVWPVLNRPTVTFVTPFNTETGVPINHKMTATFSEAMNATTISITSFTVTGPGIVPVIGDVTYDAINRTAIFIPDSDLAPSTTYIATITLGALNPAGASLAVPFVWIFTTGATPDTTNPTVILTTPSNLATDRPLNTAVNAAFSKIMDPTTITLPGTFTLKQGATLIPGVVTYVGLVATFTPSSPLAPLTKYTAKVSTAATDLAGNPLVAGLVPNPWTFTTGLTPDTTRPTVILVSPADLATLVPITTTVKATFSEAMNPGTVLPNFKLTGPGPGFTPVLGTVVYNPLTDTATFTPLNPLAIHTKYTATITTGAQDLTGNGLLNNKVWSFTTGAAPDTTRPTVILVNPANLAIGVPVATTVKATFSEPMNPGTVIPNFKLTGPGITPVLGTVVYNPLTDMATFTPSAPLAINTTYTATITNGVKDLVGNAMLVNYIWTFKTIVSLSPLAVDLGAADNFAALAGSALTNVPLSDITGDIGLGYPGGGADYAGLTCPEVNGTIFSPDAAGPACKVTDAVGLTAAKAAIRFAYLDAEGRPVVFPVISGDQGGVTLPPGVYKSTSFLTIASGNLTLNGQGDTNAVWVFQIASYLTTVGCGATVPCATGGNVMLINGADAKNVFWQVGSAATIGDHTTFKGTILAHDDISVNTGAEIIGRLLAGCQASGAGAVTLISDTIVRP